MYWWFGAPLVYMLFETYLIDIRGLWKRDDFVKVWYEILKKKAHLQKKITITEAE